MTEYQPKRDNPYRLPHYIYMQVRYKLLAYDELRQQYEDILHSSPPPSDGMPRGAGAGDQTARRAERLEVISKDLDAIDQAAVRIRGEYSDRLDETTDPVKAYRHYEYFGTRYIGREKSRDTGPSYRTWKYYRSQLAYYVAENLHMI